MAVTKDAVCSQCGAPVQGGNRTCPYCGVPYWTDEPRAANQLGSVINPIDARMMHGSYDFTNCGQVNIANGNATITICNTMDAIRAAQNQQIDCNAADWLRRQAAQAQNAIPYTPTPRPVCKEKEEKRKPFENDASGLAVFLVLVIVAGIGFVTGITALISGLYEPTNFVAWIALSVFMMLLSVIPAVFATKIYKGEYP